MISRILILCMALYIGVSASAQTELLAMNTLKTEISITKKPVPDPGYNYTFSIYPVRALANYIMVGLDKKIGNTKSFKMIGGYCYAEFPILQNVYNINGFRFEAQWKFYMGKNAKIFDGWYVAPVAGYKSSNFKMYNLTSSWGYTVDGSAQAMMLGFIAGYQFKVGKLFIGDIFLGESLKRAFGDYEVVSAVIDNYSNRVGMQGGISFGFGF